jgi:hypothetical protein
MVIDTLIDIFPSNFRLGQWSRCFSPSIADASILAEILPTLKKQLNEYEIVMTDKLFDDVSDDFIF